MGIMQVDGAGYGNKLPIHGDAADCSTYSYNVMYMRPEGFSFRCCQTGPTQNMSQESWSFTEGRIFIPRESSNGAHLYYPTGWGSPGVARSPDATVEDEKGTTYIYKGATILCNIVKAVQHLVASNVVGISSDCGFMRSMNDMVRQIPEGVDAHIPSLSPPLPCCLCLTLLFPMIPGYLCSRPTARASMTIMTSLCLPSSVSPDQNLRSSVVNVSR